jgi:hypothetical protein
MYDNRLITELKKVIGWRDHWDLTEIPALPASLTDTEYGKVYQNYKPDLVRLDYIQALLPSNRTIEEYLDTVETDAINEVLDMIVEEKKLKDNTEDLVRNNLIFTNVVRGSAITNESRFVGIEFTMGDTIGIRAIINRIGLYLTVAQTTTLKLYLFNSLQNDPVATYDYTSTAANSFQWLNEEISFDYDLPSQNTSGGIWYLGYYQDDLDGQAIQYDTLNWKNGYCSTCNGGKLAALYKGISKYVTMQPFYVASASLPVKGKLFDHDDIVYTYTNNWGFNLNVSIKCDLTQFWIDNRKTLQTAIGTMVCYKVLQMYVGSSQVSAVEQNLQVLALRAVEGAADSQAEPFYNQVKRAVETINLDEGNVNNSPCLPCSRKGATIGIM